MRRCRDHVEICLRRIDERDAEIQAMQHVDASGALACADALDRSGDRAPMHGVVVGIKDIIDTFDMPTTYGSKIYQAHRPERDAVCVSLLRSAQAILLGKTVTTEFAGSERVRTANPVDIAHSPGGSSSGSAAAVADGMVDVALGTQTGGSTIRPASYCGVFGFKPTFGLVDLSGVKPLSPSFDTIGILARDLAAVRMTAAALSQRSDFFGEARTSKAPAFLLCRTPFWEFAEQSCRDTMSLTEQILLSAGAKVSELTLPPVFDHANDAHRVIMSREARLALSKEFDSSATMMGPATMELLRIGGSFTPENYAEAQHEASALRLLFNDLLGSTSVIVTPAAPGAAPRGHATTGNPVFNSMWTMLHAPCLTLPLGVDRAGMPVGIQLVAKPGDDRLLLDAADWFVNARKAFSPESRRS